MSENDDNKSVTSEKLPSKPSGIKPPSKIGRLCSAGPPKPSIPPSPKSNDPTSDTMRKISDDFSRKYLADVQEADEEADGGQESSTDTTPSRDRKPSTCSTYSITSMDQLWEHHPRRLSEAGLRRTSDHSIVLTEDTDGFIIGDRVYVGGSKPGQIAYIGDTKFAPGEWAGVVLDEAIGKNDGSVAGIRYFQCEPKKGVFSRLTRLTREPLSLPSPASPASEQGSILSEKSPITNGGNKPPASPASVAATPRTRLPRSASPNGSVRSFSSRMSTSSMALGELKLGERVIVSSSQGSKAGTLRFMGVTEFAPGQWCGVELDDPIGKNDGSVEGKRYFECAPRFGLFAPASKVSRSPSSRRPGTCAVHGRGSPPDSLASSVRSSVVASGRPRLGVTALSGSQRLSGPRGTSTPMSAKNTLQELLREKQQHIERLIKEQETEKGELANMYMKVDNLEKESNTLKSEITKHVENIDKMKTERDEALRQLEDEKQRVDDLMFRAEEDNIHKEDFGKLKEELLVEKEKQTNMISTLELELSKVKSQMEDLQAQNELMSAQHKAEVEIIMSQHKDEVEAAHVLAKELQSLLDEAHTLLREKDTEKENINKNHFEEMSKLKTDSEKLINDLKTKLMETQLELSTYVNSSTESLAEAEKKLALLNEKLEKSTLEHNNTIRDTRSQLEQKQIALDTKIQEFNNLTASFKESELNFKKEMDKIKMQLSAKNIDYESTTEINKQLENDMNSVKSELENVKLELSQKSTELEMLSSTSSQEQKTILDEISQTKEKLSCKEKEFDKIQNEYKNEKETFEKVIEEQKQQISGKLQEIANIQDEMKKLKEETLTSNKAVEDENLKQLKEKDSKIELLNKEIENQVSTIKNMENQVNIINEENNKFTENIKNLSEQINQLQTKIEESAQTNQEINNSLSNLQLENGDLQRQMKSEVEKCTELQQQKNKLEEEIANLMSNSSNSNEQLSSISNKLREAENEISNMKNVLRENTNKYERSEQELNQQLAQLKNQLNEEKESLLNETKSANDAKAQHVEEINSINGKLIEIQQNNSNLQSTIAELESKHNVEKTELEKQIQVKDEELLKLKESNEKSVQDSEKTSESFRLQIQDIQKQLEEANVELKKKGNEYQVKEKELSEQLELSQKNHADLENEKKVLTEELTNLKKSLESITHGNQDKEKYLTEELKKVQENYSNAQKSVTEKENVLKDLQSKLSNLDLEIKSNLEIITEKDRQIAVHVTETKNIIDEKHAIDKNLNLKMSECETLQQNINRMNEDCSQKETVILHQLTALNELKKRIDPTNDSTLSNDSNKLDIELPKLFDIIEKTFAYKGKYSELENQVELSKVNFSKELEELKLKNSSLENELSESQKTVDGLKKTAEKLEKYKSSAEASEVDVKKSILATEAEKKKQEDLNKKLQSELDTIKNNSKADYEKLKAQLESSESQLSSKNKEIESEQHKGKKIQSKLEESENVIAKLKEQMEKLEASVKEANSKSQGDIQKVSLELESLQKKRDEEQKSYSAEISKLNEKIQGSKNNSSDNQKQLSLLMQELEKYKLENGNLNQDVIILRTKLQVFENNNIISKQVQDNNSAVIQKPGEDAKRLLEEKQEVEGQVSFLNSVIVDMQKKNEELKARVEILEMGVSPQEVDEFNFNGLKPKMVAPRMFCDICDIFDAHETEDCPRQTNDDVDPRQGEKKKPPPPRAYCDICEAFGHATEDCDDEETF